MDLNKHTKTKKTIDAERPLSCDGVTLLPVVETKVTQYSLRFGISCVASKIPVALLAVTSNGKKAFRISGEEIPGEDLIKEYPSIKEAVEKL